jgi:lysophospholipid acyltransferase (LPLAT)-like uncharacterized protein
MTAGAPPDARAMRDARKVRWATRLGRPFLALLGSTWRVEEVGNEHWQSLARQGRPYIKACWHGTLLPCIWANRYRGLCAMVSQHGDGEIITRLIEQLGFRTVRGSSSRGGREALVAMIREIEQGHSFAITPDGPRGPAGVPHAGVLMAAKRTGVPIIPLQCEVSRAWRMRSWDGFMVPKPFARIRVTYGAPWVPSASDDATLAEFATRMGPAPEPRRKAVA